MSPSSAPVNAGVATSLNGFGKTTPPTVADATTTVATPAASIIQPAKTTDPQSTAAPINRAVASDPASRVTSTNAFSSGDPSKPTTPVDTSNVKWDTANAVKVVQAGVVARKGSTSAVVMTVTEANTQVLDGDGARFSIPGKPALDCRFDGIDAQETAKPFLTPPQPGQPFGERAKERLKEMIDKKEITITVTQPAAPGPKTKENNYGRAVCQIDVAGKDVNTALVQEGYAFLLENFVPRGQSKPPDTDTVAARRALQQAASNNKVGMYAGGNQPELPAVYRRNQKRIAEAYQQSQGR